MTVRAVTIPTDLYGHEFEPVVDRDALRCWKCDWTVPRVEFEEWRVKLAGGGWKLTDCEGPAALREGK